MIYAYVRVSTKEQNPDREIINIKRFCQDRKMSDIIFFIDKMTGKRFDRPEYLKLKRKIKKGDTLILHELDRLGRKKKEIIKELTYFKNKGVKVMILDIPTTLVDYSIMGNQLAEFMMDMINNLLIEVFAACAEFEMEKREKRQREGYEALRQRGEWDKLGRPVKIDQETFLIAWNEAKKRSMTDKELAQQLEISKGTLQTYKKKYLQGGM